MVLPVSDRPEEGRDASPVWARPDDELVFAGQARVLHAIATGQALPGVLDLLTRSIEGQSDDMRASVLTLDGDILRHGAAPSLPADYTAAIDGLPIGPLAGSCGTAAHRGELVVVEDVLVDEKWEPYRDLAVTHGFRACWSAPILASDGAVLGTFAMYYDDPRSPATDELELIETAARLAAIALERDRDRKDLEASERRFRALFDASPVGMALLDADQVVIEANDALRRLVGDPAAGLVGTTAESLVPPEARADVRAAVATALEGRQPGAIDVPLASATDGVWAHVTIAPAPREGAAARGIAVFQDTTERHELEELRARQRELEFEALHDRALAGLAGAAVIINSQRSVEQMLSSITAQACEIIGAHQGSTSLTMPGTGEAEGWPQLGISVELSDKYAEWRDYEAPSHGTPSYGLVCAGNDVVRMTDEELKQHPLWRNFAQEEGRHPPMRGWLAAPLVASDGSNLGMLQLSDKIDGEFTEADESIVIQLAQMASVAVEKAQLAEAAAEQRQARLREELLSGLSHDMQTPLAAIVGLVDVLGESLPLEDPMDREAFGALARQTDHLYVLIQQFLDHLRLQANRQLKLAPRPLDPLVPLRRVVELFAHQREVRVEAPPVGVKVLVDPVRFQQVLTNLIANAVKFSDDPIDVCLDPGRERLTIHVEDRGVGLPDVPDPDVVFDRFYRGPDAVGTPGTGLGLYIAREVVQAMGGEIHATRRDGGGARFSITLPTADHDA